METVARKHLVILTVLFLFTLAVCVFALTQGPVYISFGEIIRILSGGLQGSAQSEIIHQIRLPRILLGAGVGGGLAITGAVFQALLLNPLAEPYILGVSSGGTFGAVFAMLLGLSFLGMELFSFVGALSVILIVFLASKRFGSIEPNTLLLTGVMAGAFFSALILLTLTLMKNSLRTAVFWLMGNLSMADSSTALYIVVLSVVVSFFLALQGNRLNLLAFGDEQASALGVNPRSVKTVIYFAASLLVGAIVSVSGIIGFVGLLAPHVCRLLWGNDNRIVVPASFFVGASLLVLSDLISRSIIPPAEIPVGAVTALLGAPFFVYLLKRNDLK